MKKILLLLLILILGFQTCLAQEDSEEDIDSYFNEEPQTIESPELHGSIEYNQTTQVQEEEQESIYLNPINIKNVNISQPKKIESKSLISNVKKPTFQPIQDQMNAASKFAAQEYNIAPISTSYGKKIGKMTFGTMYDSSLDSGSGAQSNTTGFFTKYEGKHFAFNTVFSKNTNYNYDSYSDKISIIPEWKITKRLSLLDVMQTDVYQISKRNELVLRYTPHLKKHADDVQFEVGAGQSYYNDSYVKSSVRFSTRFKL